MPTTRAARAASRAARCLTEVLPADALGLALYQLTLAHDIAAVAPTCHALCDAAKLARKLRPFSGKVVTLSRARDAYLESCTSVAAAPDGRIITGSNNAAVTMWRDGACVWTIQHAAAWTSTNSIVAVAVLPGARVVSVASAGSVRMWTLDGEPEHNFEMGSSVRCAAVLPDGVHFVAGLNDHIEDDAHAYEVRLYHVDGTLVHAFKGHTACVDAVAVTRDGQHIISGSFDFLVKVWSVASKSLVSTCIGHTDWVRAVAVTPNGQRILSCGNDQTVRVWLLNGTHQNTFKLHGSWVGSIVALPDNKHALAGSRAVKLFNINDGAVLRTIGYTASCLALMPDGLRFVSGGFDVACRAHIIEHGLAPVQYRG